MDGKSARAIAEAKIHILYLVDRCPGATYHQLLDGCMKSLYVDYFDFASAYEELIAGNLMDRSGTAPGESDAVGSSEVLTLTEGGIAVLSDLRGAINDKLRQTLDSIAEELTEDINRSSRITASAVQKDGSVEVSLGYEGTDNTIKLSLSAADKTEADRIIRKWRHDCENLTEDFIRQLLSNS